jgi:hypothetical protein
LGLRNAPSVAADADPLIAAEFTGSL